MSLAEVPGGASIDLVDSVAVPLPMLVIAELLGIPREDRERFRRWSDAMIEAGGGGFSEKTGETLMEMFAYLGDTLKRRKSDPQKDLISTLLHAEIDGEKLSQPEATMFCITLLVAGNETTRAGPLLGRVAPHVSKTTGMRFTPLMSTDTVSAARGRRFSR